jgi:hypothetical protein
MSAAAVDLALRAATVAMLLVLAGSLFRDAATAWLAGWRSPSRWDRRRMPRSPNWPGDADGVFQLAAEVIAATNARAKLAGAH